MARKLGLWDFTDEQTDFLDSLIEDEKRMKPVDFIRKLMMIMSPNV